jgi:hypothetical protein
MKAFEALKSRGKEYNGKTYEEWLREKKEEDRVRRSEERVARRIEEQRKQVVEVQMKQQRAAQCEKVSY